MRRRRLLGGLAGVPVLALAQPRPPRLVTVGGAITETVYALGAEALLVGTDTTSLYPAAAQRTPKVGYMRQLSAEGLLSLRPDWVVASAEAGPPVVLDQVRSAGVRVELVPARHDWSEVLQVVDAVGRACAREAEARALAQRLQRSWDDVRQRVAAAPRRARVLFVLSHSASPQVAGQGTAADAVIGFAGGVNCLSGFAGYRPMTAEAMAAAAPDCVLTTSQSLQAHGGAERFWARPELALTPAYARRALIAMDALELLGMGPRLPATVATLHQKFQALAS
ncbi:heme/hemin ABC transporter substrate-binding protein [Pseudorhodoferax sp.]|uniref:heme/hemin ABC transporter substrate-binding protein n=1 Tax=Pseudorhodoferax sp. TaxID=1993553 RepID=UPI0039E48F9B